MKLYTYWRSSAAYRARIALNIKQIEHDTIAVNLAEGAQGDAAYARINPQRLVPCLDAGDVVVTQSSAIFEFLEERYPAPPLLPDDAGGRARVRAIAQAVACEMHPRLANSVRRYLHDRLGEDGLMDWYRHWAGIGFGAIENMLAGHPETGRFCHGGRVTMADCFLIPQMYAGRRYGLDYSAYPTMQRVEADCLALPAFEAAMPENQADYAPDSRI